VVYPLLFAVKFILLCLPDGDLCYWVQTEIEWLRREPSVGTHESGIAVFRSDSNQILTPGRDWGSFPRKQTGWVTPEEGGFVIRLTVGEESATTL